MKILLLNPPYIKGFSRQSRSPCVTKSGTIYYPYFLAYAAEVLEKEGFDVKLIDAVAMNLSRDQTVELVKRENPSLVVIDSSTPSIYNDAAIATAIKDAVPSAHINLVGTHPTALPHETLALGKIDSVCRGEYDYTVRDLAKAIEAGKKLDGISGLSFKSGKKIIDNKPRELIKNLDELPFVSEVYKKHLNVRDYFYASLTYPQVTILSARGCPYNCIPADIKISISEKRTMLMRDFVNNPTKLVLSLNDGNLVKSSVYDVQTLQSKELVEIETEDNKKLRLTPDHKVWTKRGWIEAANLTEDDYVLVK